MALFFAVSSDIEANSVLILGRVVLLGLFIFAVYLPLRGWHSWRGAWRYAALLPILPLLGLVGYVFGFIFSDTVGRELSPELMMLVVLGSLLFSAVLGLLHNRSNA